MIKDYTDEKINKTPKMPSDQCIDFILNYSKSLHLIKMKESRDQIEVNLN